MLTMLKLGVYCIPAVMLTPLTDERPRADTSQRWLHSYLHNQSIMRAGCYSRTVG
jgi:hypothetical protein